MSDAKTDTEKRDANVKGNKWNFMTYFVSFFVVVGIWVIRSGEQSFPVKNLVYFVIYWTVDEIVVEGGRCDEFLQAYKAKF